MTLHRVVLLSSLVFFACAKPEPAPTETPAGAEPPAGEQAEPPAGEPGAPQRTEMSAAECEAQGGRVVGDIGDGAIHQPDYVCPDSGEPPMGSITPEAGGPVAVEGSVCCPAAP